MQAGHRSGPSGDRTVRARKETARDEPKGMDEGRNGGRQGKARQDKARQGKAQGQARQDKARQDKAMQDRRTGYIT